MRIAAVALVLGAAACSRRAAPATHEAAAAPVDARPADTATPVTDELDCERVSFAPSIPLPEASGAVLLPQGLLVVSDSGNHGEYVVIDPEDGHVRSHGQLPLDGDGDDLEGLSTDGQRVWAITSSGWLRAWRATGDGFELVVPAYRGAEENPCKADMVNCGDNYEGLCLGRSGDCDGWAASKASGELHCMVREGDRYRIDRDRVRPGSAAEALSDCAVAPDGAVWTGDNLFGGSQVRRYRGDRVERWRLGLGFPEVLALATAPDGATIVYRFSDTGSSPSLSGRYRCETKAGPRRTAE